MPDVFDDLALHLQARYPYVYLLTWEEGRATSGVAGTAEALGRELMTWSSVDGLVGVDGPVSHSNEPEALLDRVAELERPAVVVLKDFHFCIERPEVIRRMRDLAPLLGPRGQGLVLISPTAVVPQELEKDMVALDLPLPGLKEVARIFHSLLRGEQIEIDLALFERFVKRPSA